MPKKHNPGCNCCYHGGVTSRGALRAAYTKDISIGATDHWFAWAHATDMGIVHNPGVGSIGGWQVLIGYDHKDHLLFLGNGNATAAETGLGFDFDEYTVISIDLKKFNTSTTKSDLSDPDLCTVIIDNLADYQQKLGSVSFSGNTAEPSPYKDVNKSSLYSYDSTQKKLIGHAAWSLTSFPPDFPDYAIHRVYSIWSCDTDGSNVTFLNPPLSTGSRSFGLAADMNLVDDYFFNSTGPFTSNGYTRYTLFGGTGRALGDRYQVPSNEILGTTYITSVSGSGITNLFERSAYTGVGNPFAHTLTFGGANHHWASRVAYGGGSMYVVDEVAGSLPYVGKLKEVVNGVVSGTKTIRKIDTTVDISTRVTNVFYDPRMRHFKVLLYLADDTVWMCNFDPDKAINYAREVFLDSLAIAVLPDGTPHECDQLLFIPLIGTY